MIAQSSERPFSIGQDKGKLLSVNVENCDRLWEKGPLGSGDQFSVYCLIRKNSFSAFKCTLKHKKLIFLTEVIAF